MVDTNPHLVSIFGEALACASAEEQAAYLDRACGDNVELRAQVTALLQSHREAGHFLEGRPEANGATIHMPADAEGPGTTVGPYKLLEQIGEGGMGIVYMADQQAPVRRRVALKIIKPGMDTRQVIARFEAERQALAMMDHPNIAKVFDAGTTALGRPFFVMELVRGVPITDYCDQQNLPIAERLELFRLVCQAVQHAHQKGIIHRDIKPSNVLITLHDGRPVPKVIDFGIAKATGQQLTDKTLFTDFLQLIGTPLYMSPEQAELSGLDIDTRSDIYSLGVLLYELLTGTTPLERERLKEAAYDEVRRVIREEDPPKPSTRVSSLEFSQPGIAAMRHTEPRKLTHLLRGDLDWIVMKALEKDRTRRYETASSLAADVERHLSDQPVEACPPSAVYRFCKFARRNRATFVMSGVIATLLVFGLLGTSWQAIRATRQRDRAIAAERVAQENHQKAEQNAAKSAQFAALAEENEKQARNAKERAIEQEELAIAKRDQALGNLYVAHVRLAYEDWFAGNLTHMSTILNAHRPKDGTPDMRKWEWYYLDGLLQRRDDAYEPSLGSIHRIAWHPKGQLVAIAGENGAQVYDFQKRQILHLWPQSTQLTWSPDGSRVALVHRGEDERTVQVVTTGDWQVLHTHKAEGFVRSIVWRRDGRALAWRASRDKFCVWELSEQQPQTLLYPIPTLPRSRLMDSFNISNLAWGPEDQSLIMAGMFPSYLAIWDALKREPTQVFNVDGYRGLTHIAISPEQRRLATSTVDGYIGVWDIASGGRLKTMDAHRGNVSQCSWNPNGKQLVSAGEDNLVRIWDVETGQQIRRLSGHRAFVRAVDWSPTGDWIASADASGQVRFWRAAAENDWVEIAGRSAMAWSPDGKCVVFNDPINGNANTCSIRDLSSGLIVRTLVTHPDHSIHSFAWSPSGAMIAGVGHGRRVVVWNAASGQANLSLDVHLPEARGVAWSPDSSQLATCGMDRCVKILDVATGNLLHTFSEHTVSLGSIAWSPDGRWFASADWGRNVKIRSTNTWKIQWEINQDPAIIGGGADGSHIIAWHPNSRAIASINATGQIVVWRLGDDQQLQRGWSVQAHTSNVRGLAWSPDGSRIASASEDRTVKIWDAETGHELLSFGGFNWMVKTVAWSPDGRRLAAAAGDSLRMWDALKPLASSEEIGRTTPVRPETNAVRVGAAIDGLTVDRQNNTRPRIE